MDIVKKYNREGLSVIWKPGLCIHSENCFKGLSMVFNPKQKPWIKVEAAEIDDIQTQIDRCPSGALTYENQKNNNQRTDTDTMDVQVFENGPIMINGPIRISHSSGEIEKMEKPTAFCRCGSSENKPFCDGSHKKVDFKG